MSGRARPWAPTTHVVVVHSTEYEYPMRATVADHLYAFRRYGPGLCSYVDVARGHVPAHVLRAGVDLVLFHNSFLAARLVSSAEFERVIGIVAPLAKVDAPKAALPQDEYRRSRMLCEFIREFDVTHVFSVAPPSEWPMLYSHLDLGKVRLTRVLTGYLGEHLLRRAADRRPPTLRTIDIGYRTGRSFSTGRHGFLKGHLADVFAERGRARGLNVDISTRPQDVFRGDTWYDFLERCRYTIGMEGGSSIHDPEGTIADRVDAYVSRRPDASFEEIESACYPGRDGDLRLFALSPRHLEACLTRTGQILVEGEYDGVLKPGLHYIPLKKDLSNVEEVLDSVRQRDRLEAMTEAAYQDVVASGGYTYRRFCEDVLNTCLPAEVKPPRRRVRRRLLYAWGSITLAQWTARRAMRVRWIWPLRERVRQSLSRLLGAREGQKPRQNT